jgi:hypothetical protein
VLVPILAILLPVISIIAQQEKIIKEQIIIPKDNIKSLSSYGNYEIVNPDYIKTYNASLLFDNKVGGDSFWSNWGDSGWKLELNNPIIEKEVCSIEMGVLNPQNNTYTFKMNNSTSTGILSSNNITSIVDPCMSNLTNMSMDINTDETKPTQTRWTSISEVKLFSNKTIVIPPPPPPPEENVTKIILNDTNVTMSAIDSNIDLILEGNSTINLPPNAFHTPTPPPPIVVEQPPQPQPEPEEEEEEEEEDDDDEKDKKEDDN